MINSAPEAQPVKNRFVQDLRFDLPASLAVALVALPLCLGIAVASDAPPISGIISGIIGGLLVGALSGSHTSVSGPAAGLTAVVLAALASFDGIFETFLVAVVLAGFIQIGMGLLRAGFIANYFPNSVIRGLLAAIGLILIFKQIPHAFGIDQDPEGDFSFLQPDNENTFSELGYLASRLHVGAILVSSLCLALIILWEKTPLKKLMIPSSLAAVAAGTGLNFAFMQFYPAWALGGQHLVTLPEFDGVGDLGKLLTFPNWSQLFSEHGGHILFVAVELALIASLETLLNVEAVDKLDPQKRHSPLNRELLAQGVGNVACGLVGGLPVTSVVVRSSVNVHTGAVSKKSAIMHGAILAGSVALLPGLLSSIPLAALAAVLLYTGYKLASISVFRDYWQRGWTQFLPFIATALAILFTDLLIGILIGLGVGLFFILRSSSRTPIAFNNEKYTTGDIIRLKFSSQLTFLNRASLCETLGKLPRGAEVILDATETDYIDQDIQDVIRTFRDEEAPAHNIRLNMVGFKDSYALTSQVEYINVLTEETQRQLTPERVLQILRDGNERFTSGKQVPRDLRRQVSLTSRTQHPMAAVLSCIDSRTTSELIFDLGLGDIFSIRVAGNVINSDVLGSLEYATQVAGAKLIVVKGHTNCGAINAAIDGVKLGHVTGLLSKVQKVLSHECQTHGQRTTENPEFVGNITRLNVLASMEQILAQSPTIAALVAKGSLAIVGAIYDTSTGKVEFLDGGSQPVRQEELSAELPG
ncbi:MAG: bifunctional SulP family inorganic anion transporter/carbonic anhydrase [Planctomycetales bacterium]|nr:bifunctional SulP family inorganic anion transporter/carbonic anhydrase [Planctomycetales bacterium]